MEVVTGQGFLSTSSPNQTEGVEDSEELPMIGVKQGGNFGRFVSLLWPILSLIPPKHFLASQDALEVIVSVSQSVSESVSDSKNRVD